MPVNESVRALLDLAGEVSRVVALRDSLPAPRELEADRRSHKQATLELMVYLPKIRTAIETAVAASPPIIAEAFEVRDALVMAMNAPGQLDRVQKAYRALEVAAHQTAGDSETAADREPKKPATVRSESEISAEYRDGGLVTGDPLTADVVSAPEKYDLSGPYLSKKYCGPTLKWGRKIVYRHAEIAALSDRKTARRGDEG